MFHGMINYSAVFFKIFWFAQVPSFGVIAVIAEEWVFRNIYKTENVHSNCTKKC